jgi:streptomycin 6-kinase
MISFSGMEDNLPHHMVLWALSDPQLIARTGTSHVYAVTAPEGKAILKLLTPSGVKDEAGGAAALQWFGGQGAVRLLQCNEKAYLLEYADGEPLSALVKRGEDDKAAEVIGRLLNQLHKPGAPPAGLATLRRRFQSLFKKAEEGEALYLRGAEVADKLLSSEKDICVLHGDLHHDNIFNSQRGWLAIDPKGLVGEPMFDAANALCNPVHMPEMVENETRLLRQAEIISSITGFDRARLLAFTFAYACLSAAWSIEDNEDPTHALAMMRITKELIDI